MSLARPSPDGQGLSVGHFAGDYGIDVARYDLLIVVLASLMLVASAVLIPSLMGLSGGAGPGVLEQAGVRRKLQIEASMAPTISRGLGVALVNPLYIGGFASAITSRLFSPKIESDIHILLPKHRPQSRVAQGFINCARSFVAGLIPINFRYNAAKIMHLTPFPAAVPLPCMTVLGR
jgi:hypothetical protein